VSAIKIPATIAIIQNGLVYFVEFKRASVGVKTENNNLIPRSSKRSMRANVKKSVANPIRIGTLMCFNGRFKGNQPS
jgi:hypothetical protein